MKVIIKTNTEYCNNVIVTHIGQKAVRITITTGSQDGGVVGGLLVHLFPQMHQEYIYKWNKSHRATAEH